TMLIDQILSETRQVSDAAFRIDATIFRNIQVQSQQQRRYDAALNWLLFASSVFLCWLLLTRVLRPVARLGVAARALKEGDMQQRVSCQSKDELGKLTSVFNLMLDTVADRQRALEIANDKVQENEAFLERVGAVAGVGGWQLDMATGEITWNLQTKRISGVADDFQPTREQALAFYPPGSLALIEQAMQEAIEQDKPFDMELAYLNAQGQPLWVRIVGEAVNASKVAGTRPTRLIGAIQDITERAHSALMLQQAKDHLELALDSAGLGVWEYDLQTGTLAWDDKMFELYGLARSGGAEPYALWRDNLHPDDRAIAEQSLQDAIDGKRDLNTQFRILKANQSIVYLKANARVIRDNAGVPLRVIGVNMDVTDEVMTAAALHDNEKLLERVGSLASIGGWRVNIKTSTVYWNEQTRLIHEAPPGYVPDLASAIGFYAPEYRDLITQVVEQAIASGTGWDLELRLITYTGRSIWVRSLGEVEYEQGSAAYLVGAFQDVMERREAEEMLRDAKLAAESSNMAKSAFLANMSHEIRTPLNAVIGLTHLLAEDDLSAGQLKLVQKIQLSGRSLLGIVNDVLDLSKIEADEMLLEDSPCQLYELLEEMGGIFEPQAEAKNLQLKREFDDNLPAWVATDALRLHQILTNLLGNALKFTSIGSIRLSAQTLPTKPGQSTHHTWVRFTVSDSGIGISTEAQARLFQPFSQADTSTTRRFGGTGLGLSIVRKMVALMDGELGVESNEGVGSSFWVSLPLRIPTPQEIASQDNDSTALSLLIAEDDPQDAKRLVQMTRSLGWRTELVTDGDVLVETLIARSAKGMRPYDALIVDWQMPRMDGLQALDALSNRIGRGKLPAILMVSAFESTRIAALDKDHLADRILQKPVGSSELFNAVNDVVTHHTGNTARVLHATRIEAVNAHWLLGVRVLVVDDSSINREVVSQILEHNGAIVTTADSGEAALAHIKSAPGVFDAVLMDVQMPIMDGLETTRRVRGLLGLAALPIIALTAGALVEEKRRALEAGMNDFLTKPIDPSQLINRLRIAVETYRGRSLPVEALTAARPSPASDWPNIAGLNIDTAKRILGGDAQLLLSTLSRMVTEYASLETPPDPDIDGPDTEPLRLQIASQVHKLRGASGMIGAEQVYALSSQAENALRTRDQPVHSVLIELAGAIGALHRDSAQALDDWRQALSTAPTEAPSVDREGALALSAQELDQLQHLLATNDLEALDWVDQRTAALHMALGPANFQSLQDCLMHLDFKTGQTLLKPLQEQMSNPP
ncbi:MAG: response regulator, partial [Burkholderiaceae bacterium]|nr:response regulator [Burkholderiaceae bacterium]